MIESQKNSRNAQSLAFSAPCAYELMLKVQTIRLDTPVLDVLTLFHSHLHLPAFPVVDEDNQYFGIITRRNYFNIMSRAYARELFARKDLASLLKINPTIFAAPLIVNADDRIDQVMLDFLSLDPEMVFEALPVIDAAKEIAIIKVADMMLQLSESQGTLIDTMEQLSLRLKEEVASAATLQRNLLRPERIELPGIRGLSTLITSSEVGGDFYDYYAVEAGTMVSAAKAGVNLLEADKEKQPHKILARLSDTILHTARQSLLMTMFAICLDTKTGELTYANAGHQFAYIYRSITGTLDVLEVGGLPLGKEENIRYEQCATEMDVGDRLFLYTDGIVEEENTNSECFGYERLEELLAIHAESDAETLRDNLLASLASHVGHSHFDDDVTIFFVEHFERHHKKATVAENEQHEFDLVRIIDSFYRANPNSIAPNIMRQNLVFIAEANFSDLIPNLSKQGIRRVLPRNHAINTQLGWNNLLRQHQHINNDDLVAYLRHPTQHREFYFNHSDDKAFVLNDVESWLQDISLPNPDRLDAVVLLLDELIENGLYAAPRDGKGRQLYAKGTVRALSAGEVLRLSLSIQDSLLGISLTDSWGTLTPTVFLNRLARHIQGVGLDAGVGGGGLYLTWRMSDYLQLRVIPYKQTQVSAFLDLNNPFDEVAENGFQFLYHNEVHENINS
ncbi:MAG: SpoIIE family protein phosphatase [Methylococcaceae bacterium]|nr:SpoIIE family protein phosphatase [Methylococcaceae bacterium]